MKTPHVLTLAATALLAGAAGYHLSPAPAQTTAEASSVNPPERMIAAAGRVEPASEEIRIGADLDGRLREMPVEEGQRVHRGQIVAVLENADYKARMDLAAATVTEREAALERLINGSRTEARRAAGATVRELEAVLDHARVEHHRRVQLAECGAISRVELDLAEREFNVAKARVEAAREQEALVVYESRPEDIKRARAELDRAHAQLAEALALVEKTIIRSPIDGTVLRKHLKAGESVSALAGTTIITVGDCSALRVRVQVDENDVASLRVGQAAWVRADAYGQRRFRGTVTSIGQILGRKNVHTDEPSERKDAKILETIVQLEPGTSIPVGMRVDAYIDPRS